MRKTNYLVLGSGVAGLTFAIKMASYFPDKKVTIITKSNASESNTKYAQGGIAVVMNQIEDNFQKHIEDTLICGDGLCNEEVVKIVVTEGPKRVQELIDWGTQFDRNRLYAGVGFSINESIRVETGYMIQTQKNRTKGQLQLIVYNNLALKNKKYKYVILTSLTAIFLSIIQRLQLSNK